MRNVVHLCLAANNILLKRKLKHAFNFSFLRSLLRENGSFPKIFIKKQARWLYDKTIIRNSQSILHSTLLMDNCISHFEVAQETGSNCIMGMFGGRYGFLFGAYEVA